MELRFWLLTFMPLLALLSYAILLVMVVRRGLQSLLSRSFALYLLVMAVWSLGSAMMRLLPHHIVFWNKVTTGSAMIWPLAFFGFVQVFLNERPRRWLWVALAILVGLEIANAFGLITANAHLLEGGLIGFDVGPLTYIMAIFNIYFMALSLWWLARAHGRASDPVLRNRIRYPLIGASAVLLGGLTNVVDVVAGYPIDQATSLLNASLLAYAVFRYQLADITLVVRRGLLYSIPTVIIGVGYFLVISLATVLFNVVAGPQLLLISLLVAAMAALAAQPLRDRAQLWIDRLFFREKYDASLMLQRLSGTAASELDLGRLTSLILDGITTTMHIEQAAFFIRQEEGGEFRLMAQGGLDENADMRLRSDHPLVDWLSHQERALSRYEMDLIPQFKALWGHEAEDLQRLAAELFIPLKAKDALVGVLTVGPKRSEEAYSQDDLRTLTTLANQTATALENARLHEEMRRRYGELALLNRIIAASATSRQMDTLLRTVCRELSLAFGELQAAAVLLNEDETEATVVLGDSPGPTSRGQATGLGELLMDGRSQPSDQAIPVAGHLVLQRLLQHGAPLIMDDAWTDPRLASILDTIRQAGIASLLNLPLLVEGEVVGLICLAVSRPYPFSAEEIDLARRVADQVSGALARTRLEETQRRLSVAVEQAAEAVLITDTEGGIIYVNPAFEQITGYRQAEVVGQNTRLLGDDRLGAVFHQQMWQAVTAGRVWQEQLDHTRKDGSPYTLDSTVAPVRNEAGEVVSYIATMRDVTREVQLERQFHQAQKMEALGRLAGGIAHDFNNLLTIIQLSTRLLQRELDPEHSLAKHVQNVQDAGERAVKLTRQLLTFSRREIVERQVLSLNQLVGDLSQMLRRIIGEDIELVTVASEELWSIKVDPAQMEQVVMNLVVNARDAMPEGGTLTIETANAVLDRAYVAAHPDAQPGEHVMLSISDTGVGMDDEVIAHIFEPFFTTKGRGRGTGLGLSTVFGIVKQNDGHIQVRSKLGQGTTFQIYLPRSKEMVVRVPSHAAPVAPARGTETVLVVEDEADVRLLTANLLTMQGYQVLVASDGVEALQVSEAHDGPIHLLLTDVVMPQLGGTELAEQLQPQRPDMRVLYMSGYADRPLVKRFLSDPNVAFLPKPFNAETLAGKVHAVLEDLNSSDLAD